MLAIESGLTGVARLSGRSRGHPACQTTLTTQLQTALAQSWTIYCDGSVAPNPGRMGLGATLLSPEGLQLSMSQVAQGRGCNNEAELRAVIAALALLASQGATEVLVYSDNSIVVEQLTRADAKPVARLASLFEEAREMLRAFEQVKVVWIPRQRNKAADALARAALGLSPKVVVPSRKRR